MRGLDVISPEQMYQSLFAPDLIRERLAGDPDGEFKSAARVLNLRTVLDSGRVPTVALVSPAGGSASNEEVITAQARIADARRRHRPHRVAREWRHRRGDKCRAQADGSERVVSQALALEPGDNTVEVVAYNARNRLASLPADHDGALDGAREPAAPEALRDRGRHRPIRDTLFRRLSLAVADAKAFGAAMKTAGERSLRRRRCHLRARRRRDRRGARAGDR